MTTFSRTLLSTAVLTAVTMGSAFAAAPVQTGFQVHNFGGNRWVLTNGNVLNGETTVNIQTNSQGNEAGNFDDVAQRDNISTILIDTAGQTVEGFHNNWPLKDGKALNVEGSTGAWNGKIVLGSGAKNSSEVDANRTITLNLENSEISGLIIENGEIYKSQQNTTPTTKNTNNVNLKNVTINGDISHQGSIWSKFSPDYGFTNGTFYLTQLEGNVDNITLSAGSSWTGNFVTKGDKVKHTNTITLNGSTWTGHAADNADETTLKLQNGSVWTVTSTGAVAVTPDNRIEKLESDASSKVVLTEGSNLDVHHATGDLNINFKSLNSSANFENLEAKTTLTADASLNDGTQSLQALANQMKDKVTATAGAPDQWSVNEGLMTNGGSGIYNAQGEAITTGTTTNSNLQTIAETTAITMMQWRAEADDLQQRMGELRQSANANGVWVRTFGGKSEANVADFEFNGFQFGYDHQVSPMQFVGGALSYTKGDGTFAKGSSDAESIGIAAYSTWMKDNGAYIDVIAKAGKLTNDFDINAGTLGKLAGKYSTQALALTVESGHRFPVANVFYVEPQVAFTASHIFGENYGAGQGVTVEQDSINSYVARAGVAAGIQCPDNMGSAWVRASYLYDFDGETKTTGVKGAANTFTQDFGGGWYELGVGGSLNFTKNLHGYADFEYVAGSPIDTPYKWNLGVRYTY